MDRARVPLRIGLILLLVSLLGSTAPAERLPVRTFTSADGLGSSFVNYLAKDSRGFMWFCTRDGLSRFDGSRFVTYQIGEQGAQPGIENLFEASNGIYWITTTAGTYRFDPNRVPTTITDPPRLDAEHVFDDRGSVFEDSKGNLWLAADGLFKIEDLGGRPTAVKVDLGVPLPVGVGLNVGSVREWGDGSLWLSTSVGIIRRLPSGQRVFYPDPEQRLTPGGSVRMLLDTRGFVWISLSNKLYVTKPEELEAIGSTEPLIIREIEPTKIIDVAAGAPVPMPGDGELFEFRNPDFIGNRFAKEVLQASDGSVWIACEDTLLEFSNGVLNVHTSADGLPTVMGDLAEDNANNIWIAGQSWLARLNRGGLVSFGKEDGTASDRVLTVFETAGKVHVGTTDSNVAVFDGRRFTSVRPGIAHSTAHLWTSRPALRDSRGDWWILTSNKLYRFSGASSLPELANRPPSAVYGRESGLTSDGIFQIYEDSRGDMWISTRGTDASANGLSRLRAGATAFETFTEQNGFPPRKSPASFAQDENGDVWIGLFEGGVLRFDGSRFHEMSTPADGSVGPLVTDLHFDARGKLWITSASSGVLEVTDPGSNNPSFVKYSNSNGLSSNNVRTVTEDRYGRIYFGTARGVDRLSPDTGRVRSFSVADGLPADFVSDSHRDSNGNIWFATNGGVARLIPVPDRQEPPPNVWLGTMRVAGDAYPLSDLGTSEVNIDDLADWQNSLQVEFFGIDFRAGETLRYQYRLEGADGDWSPPDTNRTVTFANLRPGKYRFLVRAVNSEGVAGEKPAVVSFTILPPLWQRWWFVLIVALVIAFAIVLVFRYRLANLRRINRALSEAKAAEENLRKAREERLAEVEGVRARIATDLHDDIGASLTQIAILSEVAQARAAAGNGAVTEPLGRITDVSNELVGTMSDIVWAINPTKDHLSDLTQRMRRVASDLLSPKNVVVHFHSRDEDKAVTIKTNARREVFLIFKESVNNISKHSGAKNVYIDLEIDQDLLLLRIRDDGHGFVFRPPSYEDTLSSTGPSGNGLRNMQKRAAEMGGRFEISSEPGKGTTTFLTIPLDSSHVTIG
jgi:signal transduction histidine kinase/ligand-binding sensor domain-containing protein